MSGSFFDDLVEDLTGGVDPDGVDGSATDEPGTTVVATTGSNGTVAGDGLRDKGALGAYDPELAWEVASDLLDREVIAAKWGLTVGELDMVLERPEMARMVVEARREWEAAETTPKRVRLKAAMLAEARLLDIGGIISDVGLPASSRVDAFRTLTRVAGLDAGSGVGEGGDGGFRLILNLGGAEGKEAVTIEAGVSGRSDRQVEDPESSCGVEALEGVFGELPTQ